MYWGSRCALLVAPSVFKMLGKAHHSQLLGMQHPNFTDFDTPSVLSTVAIDCQHDPSVSNLIFPYNCSSSWYLITTEDMDPADDFNSSDIELPEAPPDPHAHLGSRSIAAMIETASRDRVQSKIESKMLRQDSGAPATQLQRRLWSNRFDAFRTHTLKQK